jgi:glycosyltransferase involved in cell wall biosynthesis
MVQRETALLKRADVVFTGGPSLFEAKRGRHPNVHCVPSAVDADHYAPALDRRDDEAVRLMAGIARPRLGFFGVIDERFDPELIAGIADAQPDWQLILVGPVVKIDVAQLPARPNLHWLGQQPYERLPGLVAGWDVCLLPFALNESTRFISPTKTLEYMAAEKPIVTTPIHDVVSLYGDAVRVAATTDDFVAACAAALAERPEDAAIRLERMREHVSRTTWDKAAQTIRHQIENVVGSARNEASRDAVAPARALVETDSARMRRARA